MGKKLYVGNLPFSATDESLQQKFAEAGAVESAKIIVDRMSGRSKGFGFVEMSNDEDASSAVNKLNGSDFGGRPMTVAEARPQEKRDDHRGGGGGGRSHGGGGGGGGNGFRRDRY